MKNVDFLLELYCLVADTLNDVMPEKGLRQRGFAPILSDAEVITIELAAECWGMDADKIAFGHFLAYHRPEFPALARITRSTFVRQAANLFLITRRMLERLARRLPAHGAHPWLIDSMPVPVCRFARAQHSRLFKGIATFGYDHLSRHIFYGFKLHLRAAHHGPIADFELAPAHASDTAVVPELVPPQGGIAFADRNYWDPALQKELARDGFTLAAPFKKRSSDPTPERSAFINRIRQNVETVFGQLVQRFAAKHVRARDLWHLCHRMTRKILAHAAAVFINLQHRNPPLQLNCLLE